MSFALFKGDQMISKPHSTRDACAAEAYERGLVTRMPTVSRHILSNGVEIRDLNPPEKGGGHDRPPEHLDSPTRARADEC